MTEDKKTLTSFESALKELEEIVIKMEKGGLSLEESIANFEKGVGLSRQCQDILKASEQKVQTLVGQGLSAFDPENLQDK